MYIAKMDLGPCELNHSWFQIRNLEQMSISSLFVFLFEIRSPVFWTGLELLIFLPPSPKFWDYRSVLVLSIFHTKSLHCPCP